MVYFFPTDINSYHILNSFMYRGLFLDFSLFHCSVYSYTTTVWFELKNHYYVVLIEKLKLKFLFFNPFTRVSFPNVNYCYISFFFFSQKTLSLFQHMQLLRGKNVYKYDHTIHTYYILFFTLLF